jgi:hypothetical protein|nr:MAG TPA: hypothetical protein [Caudoviricetes sp.]
MKYAIRTILAVAAIGGGAYAMSSTDGTPDRQCTQHTTVRVHQVTTYEQSQVIEQHDKPDAAEHGDAEASR